MPLVFAATSQLTVDEALLRQLASCSARLVVKVTQETADAAAPSSVELPGPPVSRDAPPSGPQPWPFLSAHACHCRQATTLPHLLRASLGQGPQQQRPTSTRLSPARNHPLSPAPKPRSRLLFLPRRRPRRLGRVGGPRAARARVPRRARAPRVRRRLAVCGPPLRGHEGQARAPLRRWAAHPPRSPPPRRPGLSSLIFCTYPHSPSPPPDCTQAQPRRDQGPRRRAAPGRPRHPRPARRRAAQPGGAAAALSPSHLLFAHSPLNGPCSVAAPHALTARWPRKAAAALSAPWGGGKTAPEAAP